MAGMRLAARATSANRIVTPANVTGIGRCDPENPGLKHAAPGDGSGQSKSQTHAGENQSLPADQTDDVKRAGADGEADADFVGALSDTVGHDTVDAGTRQQQGEHSEGGRQHQQQAALSGAAQGARDELLHRGGFLKAQARLNFADGALCRFDRCLRVVTRGANDEGGEKIGIAGTASSSEKAPGHGIQGPVMLTVVQIYRRA